MKSRVLLLSLLFPAFAAAQTFDIERMPDPPGVDPQIGGIDVTADGKLAVVFHRGEVMLFDPATKTWSRFAEGLHEPLGVLVDKDGSLLVMQRAELTRLRDTNGDGKADVYQTLFDEFGMSGNYHEFAFGPARGPDGSLYIGLNVASNQAGVRPEIRGPWTDIGELNFQEMQNGPNWGRVKDRAGRMHSRVGYRGWIMKLSPDGTKGEPYASGVRSPDGIGFDAKGNLLVTDNQGDWVGTSPLFVINKGNFYGHPASLVWTPGWNKGPTTKLTAAQLEAMRTPESARFPHGELANSPTQPVLIPETWGPYAGQVIIGEMNQPRLIRYLSDEVKGSVQGTLVSILDRSPLGNGSHRMAFTSDGTMWVGKTHLSWAGAEGLYAVKPKDLDKFFTVTAVKLEKSGSKHAFRVFLSQPAENPGNPGIRSYDFLYHAGYGAPKINEKGVQPSKVTLDKGGSELVIEAEVTKGHVHAIDLSSLRSAAGAQLDSSRLFYQANELP